MSEIISLLQINSRLLEKTVFLQNEHVIFGILVASGWNKYVISFALD